MEKVISDFPQDVYVEESISGVHVPDLLGETFHYIKLSHFTELQLYSQRPQHIHAYSHGFLACKKLSQRSLCRMMVMHGIAACQNCVTSKDMKGLSLYGDIEQLDQEYYRKYH